MKRARFGLKIYELCESGSGYICNSFVHVGRADQMDLVQSSDGLTSSRIVMTLMTDLLGLGYQLFVDNFYSSPALFAERCSRQTDAVGTVRVGQRGMPPSLRKKIAKNTTKALFTLDVMALKWHDKKEVTMLSTVNDNAIVRVQKYGV